MVVRRSPYDSLDGDALSVSPQFRHKESEPRFFVRSLDPSDQLFADGYRLQIQFLNEDEEGEACIEFRPDEDDFSCFPLPVPPAVVKAARSGICDYVDAEGCCRLPGFLGGGKIQESNGRFG